MAAFGSRAWEMTTNKGRSLLRSPGRLYFFHGLFFFVCQQEKSERILKKVWLMPYTHRRRRRDLTVELRRVGAVNAPVGSHDPVYTLPYC